MTDGYSGTVGTPEPILVPSRSPTRELSAALSGKALENAFVAGVYLLAYVALDWLSYVQPILKLGITPWNPQAGLTVALLLVRGPVWGVVAAAARPLAWARRSESARGSSRGRGVSSMSVAATRSGTMPIWRSSSSRLGLAEARTSGGSACSI